MVYKSDKTQISFGEESSFGVKPVNTSNYLGILSNADMVEDDDVKKFGKKRAMETSVSDNDEYQDGRIRK